METLYHHGIKGQKWGVRRFQNEDGSLTLLGKKRYGERSGRQDKPKSPSVKDMSDDDLRKAVNRLQMEDQYKRLTTPPKKSHPIREAMGRALLQSGETAVKTIATAAFTYAGKAVVKKFTKPEMYKAMFPNSDKDDKKDKDKDKGS